jgi:DNA-binding LacI/PurR family transcriptional regulator
VRRDAAAIGRSGAELMLARLGGAADVQDVTLPTEFIARPSCGPVPARGAAGGPAR